MLFRSYTQTAQGRYGLTEKSFRRSSSPLKKFYAAKRSPITCSKETSLPISPVMESQLPLRFPSTPVGSPDWRRSERIREGGGDCFVFYGYDADRNVETRIRIDWKLSQLKIQEDYRTPYWALASVLAPVSRHAFPNVTMFKGSPSEYKFRNRFTLTRK